MRYNPTTLARFWEKVEKTDACWLWQGRLNHSGYGQYWAAGRNVFVHRFVYELTYGAIPAGLIVDHVRDRGCTHRHCVNPAHLEAITTYENNLRGDGFGGKNARKTHCVHGHPLSGPNLQITPQGRRRCRACSNRRTRRWRSTKAGQAEMTGKRYMTKKEAAAALGVSVKTLDRRIKAGTLRRTIVHGPHGPEIRVLLDDDAGTADVPPTPDTGAVVQGFAPATLAMDRTDTRAIDVPDPEVHRALAAALRDALAANQAWAHRYDTLATEVESLRRPWWRKVWEKVGRRP